MTIFTVDTTADIVDAGDGVLSLREALALADATEAADTILFDDAVQGRTIVLAGSQLTVNSDITIDGGSGVTLDADGKSRVLQVGYYASGVTLAHLTVTGGRTTGTYDLGGGIFAARDATLSLYDATVSGNSTAGDRGRGGGIYGSYVTLTNCTITGNRTVGEFASGGGLSGSVTLINSTVSGNSTAGERAYGGAISGSAILTNSTVNGNGTVGERANGGGIAGSATLTNSTVSGNGTTGEYARGGGLSGSVTLRNSTVSGNTTAGEQAAGGGISTYGLVAGNSIIAGNTALGSIDPDVAGGVLASNGLNIFGSDVDGNAPSDRENVPADLLFAGGLAANGGSTQTIALRDATDNPALGRGDPDQAPSTDQRGVARPAPEDTNPDIGAFELDQLDASPPPMGMTFTVTSTSDVSADDGVLTLREALALADADNQTADRIEFAPAVQGRTILLGGSELTVNSDISIDGGAGVTIDANQASRVLLVRGLDSDVVLQHLNITGGQTTGIYYADGGGIRAEVYTTLTLEDTTVYGNVIAGSGAGGGIYAREVTLIDSAISGNRVVNGGLGGGIYGYSVTLTNSTVSENYTVSSGGGISSLDVTLTNSTVSGNQSGYSGGGISGGDMTLINSEVSDNHTTGAAARGGGIFSFGSVVLTKSIVRDNSTTGSGAHGGGIYGSVTMTDSTVRDNSTAGRGAHGGGISGSQNVILTNSTVSGNSTATAYSHGGGIYGEEDTFISLTNSTVSYNSTSGTAARGGGIYGYYQSLVSLTNSTVSGNTTAGARSEGGGINADGLVLRNSIIAGNAATGSADADVTGRFLSNGLNVFGSDVEGNALSDRENVPVGVLFAGGLADNGGSTQTIALRDAPDNPALGRGDPDPAPTTDQRGLVRPSPEGTNPDIGAFELDQSDPNPPPAPGQFIVTSTGDLTADDGVLTLREALALADVDRLTADRIEFATDVQGQTIVLAGSELAINSDVSIDGGAGITIDANQLSRVLLVQGLDSDVALRHVTITGGRTTSSGGGISAYESTTLVLDHGTVRGNSTTGYYARGGGISGDEITLTHTTVSGNSTADAFAGGGGIYGDDLTLINSTVSGNSTAGDFAAGGGVSAGIFGSMTLTNSTVSGNSAANAAGGGIYAGRGSITVSNSIVAGNTTANSAASDVVGNIGGSNGHNIFGSDVVGNASGDLESIPTSLLFGGGLADNGGPTQTIALRDASDNPALAGADPADAPATDQRGVARPTPVATDPDIGAFELSQTGAVPMDIVGTEGDDCLSGTPGPDVMRGLGGDDRLFGRAGDDALFGDAGCDVLTGNEGIDAMTGGEGADRFLFRCVVDAPPEGPNYDEILDFSRNEYDRIDLRPIDAARGRDANQGFCFIGQENFTRAGQLRYEATADGDFLVSGNTDRDLAADFAFVVRTDLASLKASDFLL